MCTRNLRTKFYAYTEARSGTRDWAYGGKRSKYTSLTEMSHEFEVHHLLNELVSLLHVRDTYVDVDSYADLLVKNKTPYVTTQVQYPLPGIK